MDVSKLATYFTECSIEDVQRTIINGTLHVIGKVFHLHFHTVPFVVFATFELLISILLGQSLRDKKKLKRLVEITDSTNLNSPLALRFPIVGQSSDHHWLEEFLVFFDKLHRRHFLGIDSRTIVGPNVVFATLVVSTLVPSTMV